MTCCELDISQLPVPSKTPLLSLLLVAKTLCVARNIPAISLSYISTDNCTLFCITFDGNTHVSRLKLQPSLEIYKQDLLISKQTESKLGLFYLLTDYDQAKTAVMQSDHGPCHDYRKLEIILTILTSTLIHYRNNNPSYIITKRRHQLIYFIPFFKNLTCVTIC